MHYSNRPQDVRVDFFEESGRWRATRAVTMSVSSFENRLIHDNLKEALNASLAFDEECQTLQYAGMHAVCLEPVQHQHPYPISVRVPSKGKFMFAAESRRGDLTYAAQAAIAQRERADHFIAEALVGDESVVDAIVGLFSVARFAGNLEADCAALRILQKRIGLDDDELRMLEKLYMERNR